jgi:hypothetical protein
VNSSGGLKSSKFLKERAKERLANRELPLSTTFDEYMEIRSSFWILEERVENGRRDFFCDCPVGMKVIDMLFNIMHFLFCSVTKYAILHVKRLYAS